MSAQAPNPLDALQALQAQETAPVPLWDNCAHDLQGGAVTLRTNVVDGGDTEKKISATLQYLSDVLSGTLGPYGTTTLISNSMLQHTATKDGFSVLKEIAIQDPVARTVLDLVKRISFRLVRTVGDGSTTSVVASNSIYRALKNNADKFRDLPPKDLMDALRIISTEVQAAIKANALKVSDEEIPAVVEKIAFIATNNDSGIAKLIRKIYEQGGRFTNIQVETKSVRKEHAIEFGTGMDIHRGMVNPIFATRSTETDVLCEMDDPYIFLATEELIQTDIDVLARCMEYAFAKQSGLVIIAKGYSTKVKEFLFQNKMNQREMPILAIDIAVENREQMHRFADIEIFSGCKPYDRASGETPEQFFKRNGIQQMGRAGKIVSSLGSTRIVGGKGDPEVIEERVGNLRTSINELNAIQDQFQREEQVAELRRRIANLSDSMAVIKVGGETPQEAAAVGYLIEDAAFACRSAIEHGQVVGGSLIVPKLFKNDANLHRQVVDLITEKTLLSAEEAIHLIRIVGNAFEDVFRLVIRESGREAFREKIMSQLTAKTDLIADEPVCDLIVDACTSEMETIFNAKTHTFETFPETNIVNSAQTDIEVVSAVLSIIGLIGTSNQFIAGRH